MTAILTKYTVAIRVTIRYYEHVFLRRPWSPGIVILNPAQTCVFICLCCCHTVFRVCVSSGKPLVGICVKHVKRRDFSAFSVLIHSGLGYGNIVKSSTVLNCFTLMMIGLLSCDLVVSACQSKCRNIQGEILSKHQKCLVYRTHKFIIIKINH